MKLLDPVERPLGLVPELERAVLVPMATAIESHLSSRKVLGRIRIVRTSRRFCSDPRRRRPPPSSMPPSCPSRLYQQKRPSARAWAMLDGSAVIRTFSSTGGASLSCFTSSSFVVLRRSPPYEENVRLNGEGASSMPTPSARMVEAGWPCSSALRKTWSGASPPRNMRKRRESSSTDPPEGKDFYKKTSAISLAVANRHPSTARSSSGTSQAGVRPISNS